MTDSKTGVDVKALAEGTAYIIVKDADNNVVTTLPVTVTAKRAAATLELDTYSFVLSKTVGESKAVTAKVKDQYGGEMTITGNVTTELLAVPSGVIKDNVTIATANGKVVTFAADNSTVTGTYTYRIKATAEGKEVSNIVTVNVREAAGAVSYGIEFAGVDANSAVDLSAAADTDVKAVTCSVIKMNGGVKAGTEANVTYTVKYQDGSSYDYVDGSVITLSRVTGGAVEKLAKTGTYTVTAKATVTDSGKESTVEISKTFTVSDTQLLPTITVKNTNAEGSALGAVFANTDKVAFAYDGSEATVSSGNIEITSFSGTPITNGDGTSTIYVTSVRIKFTTAGGGKVYTDIPVNATFTNVGL